MKTILCMLHSSERSYSNNLYTLPFHIYTLMFSHKQTVYRLVDKMLLVDSHISLVYKGVEQGSAKEGFTEIEVSSRDVNSAGDRMRKRKYFFKVIFFFFF